MAAKKEIGVDYFPHEVSMSKDKKIQLVEAECGSIAYAVYTKLLEEIYGNGYFILLDDDTELLFVKNLLYNVSIDQFKTILQVLVKRGLFEQELWINCRILTSYSIQRRYLRICAKRDNIQIFSEYWLYWFEDEKALLDKREINALQGIAKKMVFESLENKGQAVMGFINAAALKQKNDQLPRFLTALQSNLDAVQSDLPADHGVLRQSESESKRESQIQRERQSKSQKKSKRENNSIFHESNTSEGENENFNNFNLKKFKDKIPELDDVTDYICDKHKIPRSMAESHSERYITKRTKFGEDVFPGSGLLCTKAGDIIIDWRFDIDKWLERDVMFNNLKKEMENGIDQSYYDMWDEHPGAT